MQRAFQEKLSYTMAVRGLLIGGTAMVRLMRAFAVASKMVRARRVDDGGSCFSQFVSCLVARYALMTWNSGEDVV